MVSGSDEHAEEKGEEEGETIEDVLDDILRDFAALLPPDLLEDARELVLGTFAAHPNARVLTARIEPRAIPEASGTEATSGAAREDDPAKAGGARG
jgi:hypothetical protein